jgi:hypothetical protein
MRIATVVLVCALLCGCGFTKRLFVAQSDPRPVWCPPSVLEPCESLKPPASAADADFKAAARGWIEEYKACRLKQEILADCVAKYNEALDSTKK